LDLPNTGSSEENQVRRRILGAYRGYPDRALFAGFPSDIIWRRVQLELCDFATLRYLNDESRGDQLLRLSGGTRRVTDGARNFSKGLSNEATAHINPIATALRNGHEFAPLITVGSDDGSLILVEGNSRATAYVVECFAGGVEAFVGCSSSMSRWVWY
jgi:hypothetical protein